MTDDSTSNSRRKFLTNTALGVAALPLAGLAFNTPRARAEQPRLDENAPEAEAVNYVHDAADAADDPAYEEGQVCSNCALWTGNDDEWGGCAVFPGQLVNADGWCNVWVPAG